MSNIIYSEEEVTEIISLYESGIGPIRILEKIKKGNKGKIEYVLKINNVEMRQQYLGRPRNSFSGTRELIDFINGILLGDGCLFPICGKHKSSGLTVTQKSSHKDFLVWIKDLLFLNNVPSKIYKAKNKEAHILYTPRAIEFNEIHAMWYSDKKIVPKDIHITKRAFLAWYLGDGTKHKTNAITLYTNSFSFEDVEFLVSCIYRDLNINCWIVQHTPGKNSWSANPYTPAPTIYIPKDESLRLFDFLGPCPIDSMSYKWPG